MEGITIVTAQQLRERSLAFLRAAERLHEIVNRFVGGWFPTYYLLTHALELGMKARILEQTCQLETGHNLMRLICGHPDLFDFDEADLTAIKQLMDLNSGPGGLRYPNDIQGDFLPSVFDSCTNITRQLIREL